MLDGKGRPAGSLNHLTTGAPLGGADKWRMSVVAQCESLGHWSVEVPGDKKSQASALEC